MNRDRLGIWEMRPVSNSMLIVHCASIALSFGGVVFLFLNLELINRSLYAYGIWAVPPIGAIAGLLLFGFIWGSRPLLRKLTVGNNG